MTTKPACRLASYGLAIGLTGVALVITLLLEPILPPTLDSFFFIAVAIGAWYGGIVPGALAAALSAGVITYGWHQSIHPFTLADWANAAWSDAGRGGVFLLAASIVVWLMSHARQMSGAEAIPVAAAQLDREHNKQGDALESASPRRVAASLNTAIEFQQLQDANRRWQALLDTVQLVAVGLDRSGQVFYVNPAFLDLTGYSAAEVIGKDWFASFLLPDQILQANAVFHAVLEHNLHPHQSSIRLKSGEERLISWSNTILQTAQGDIIGTMSLGEDITQRQQIERIKAEFISIVSHELRTPLTVIRGSLGLLAAGVYDHKPEKGKRMLQVATEQSDRLVRLVNDILDLGRLESGHGRLAMQRCNAATLIQQSIAAMRADADQHGITLLMAAPAVCVWAAPDAIIQTLSNLLSNAIKFSPANTLVWLTAELVDGDPAIEQAQSGHSLVLFKVTDQGRGIPPDKIEAIFERFQQVDASDSRQKGGTGLGLAICRRIIQQHGGHIWAESAVGQGSTFCFQLPSAPESEEA